MMKFLFFKSSSYESFSVSQVLHLERSNNTIMADFSNVNNNSNLGPSLSESPMPVSAELVGRQVTKSETPQAIANNKNSSEHKPVNVLMIGTGEYTTGFVHGKESDSDKSKGVVALTLFDMRSKHKTGRLGLCGVSGKKFPGIRNHLDRAIHQAYSGLSTECETFPADNEVDPKAYETAISTFSRGDAAIIFTPDDTHFEIALACIKAGMHVLITKPAVKTLEEHKRLHDAAVAHNVLVAIEVHKRWDPIYSDARDRIQNLGNFSYLYSYMSQPKHQLETFKSWAGKSSDISYYLNSHHIDFHEWVVGENSRPIKVTAVASTGVASGSLGISDCEDTITLAVEWENIECETVRDSAGFEQNCKVKVTGTGTAVYTSSWIAPKSDVHSQQRFFYMGQKGEINVDQAHRGYNMAADDTGYASVNPLFMKYVPRDGKFVGQLGYGYRYYMFICILRGYIYVSAFSSLNESKRVFLNNNSIIIYFAIAYITI